MRTKKALVTCLSVNRDFFSVPISTPRGWIFYFKMLSRLFNVGASECVVACVHMRVLSAAVL